MIELVINLNRNLPESWTNSITERPDASKIFPVLTKNMFENIKRGILWTSGMSPSIQVLHQTAQIN